MKSKEPGTAYPSSPLRRVVQRLQMVLMASKGQRA
jgi:hypothetical protein